METCLDESTKYGYSNLLVNLEITVASPSYNVIRAMGMVSEELRLHKIYGVREKGWLEGIFKSINGKATLIVGRCLELNKILCTEMAVKEYFSAQVSYYADKRFAAPLLELVRTLLNSTHSYHFRMAEVH